MFQKKKKNEAKFWVRRFRDAWNSCSHKKALTVGIFMLVWNLSSIVARIWAGKVTLGDFIGVSREGWGWFLLHF